MRVAIAFNAFGSEKTKPYIKAQHGTVITVKNHQDAGVEVVKSSINVTESGIQIGAVSYPYDHTSSESYEIAKSETRAVKKGTMVWKCVKDASGNLLPVKFNSSINSYVDSNGTRRSKEAVQHLYFNSKLLEEERAKETAGIPLSIPRNYYDWMILFQNSTKIIDVATPTGRDMVRCLQEVYFGNFTPRRDLVLPEFYIRCGQVLPFKEGYVDGFVLKMARTSESILEAELCPVLGVITFAEYEDGNLVLGITKVCTSENELGAPVFQLTDQVVTVKYPVTDELEVLINKVTGVSPGDTVDSSFLVGPFTRLVRYVPYDPSCSSYGHIESKLTEQARDFLREKVVDQHQPSIQGARLPSLSIIEKMPTRGGCEIFMRNRRLAYLFEGHHTSLVCRPSPFVTMDLLHHQWFDKIHPPTSGNRYQQRTTPARSSGIGSMVQEAMEHQGLVQVEQEAVEGIAATTPA